MAVVDINSRDVLPALPLVAGFVIWSLARLIVEQAVRWYSPKFYKELQENYEAKHMVFFGVLLGLISKPITLATCGLAVWNTPAQDDIAGTHPPMNTYQEYCWNSRIVVYASELPHYIHVPELLLHHLLILMSMGVIARWRVSHRGLDLALAALWGEIPNSLRTVLRKSHCLENHPRFDWHLACWTTVFGFLTRGTAIIMAMAMIPQSGLQGGPAFIAGSAYFFYLAYIFNLTYRRLRSSDILQLEDLGVFRLRLSDACNINSTSLMTGLAVLGTQVSTLSIYTWAKQDASRIQSAELINITWNLLMAVSIAISGSQLLAPQLQKLLHWRRLCSVYLQAGILIAAAVLTFTPTLQRSVDRPALVACVIVCSSFSKAASQMASHLDSVEKGLYSRASVVCSLLNLSQFIAAVVSVIIGRPVIEVAFKSILLQLLIRLAVDARARETSKPESRPTSWSLLTLGILAALQVTWPLRNHAIGALPHFGNITTDETVEAKHLARIAVPARLSDGKSTFWFVATELLVFVFMYVCFQIIATCFCRKRPIARPCGRKDDTARVLFTARNTGLVSLGIWICCIAYLASQGETPESHNQHREPQEIVSAEPPFCTLLLSWQFWLSISASVVLSTVAAHIWQPRSLSQKMKRSPWVQEWGYYSV